MFLSHKHKLARNLLIRNESLNKDNMNPAVKRLMRVVLIVKSVLGFSMGVYEATCGAYFYDRFGGSMNSSTALMLAMVLLAGRQGLIMLLEMPTGALADTIGRVQVVLISWVARTAFFFCLASMWFCSNVSLAVAIGVVASIFWAICYTCFNGAFSAWCVDYLKENSPDYPYSIIASSSHNYFTTASIIGTPIGIMAYLWGYAALVYTVVGVLCMVCMGYCLFRMKENRSLQFVERDQVSIIIILQKMCERLWNSCAACRQRPALFWVVMTFGSFMFLLNIIKFVWPVFLKETTGLTQWSTLWIALAVSCDVVCAISSRCFVWVSKMIDRIVSPMRRLDLFSWIFSGISVVSALMVTAHGYATAHQMNSFSFLVITILIVVACFGVMGGLFETLVNYYIGEKNDRERATIISSGSLIRSLLFLFLAVPSTGPNAAHSPVYWIIPAGLLLISGITSLLMLQRAQREVSIGNGAI